MREFVVIAHDAPTTPGFSYDDLPGAGRLDLVCRAVSAALFTSHGIRSSVRVHLVHQDSVTITVDADSLRNARPDERSIAGLLNTALETVDDAIGQQPADAAPGITVRTRDLDAVLSVLQEDRTLFVLHEAGEPVIDRTPPDHPVFVLSDHRDFTAEEQQLFTDKDVESVRLSPEVIHTDHAITLAHQWIDTAGYTRG